MKKIILSAFIVSFILIVYSCSKDSGTTQSAVDPNITYAKDIAPIMSAYCTSCHGSAGGVNLTTKANVIANISASISSIQRGSMPPSGAKVSSAELAKLKSWDRAQ